MRDHYDVVIAGAGIAGLSLAALLSLEENLSILLIEKSDAPGGRFKVQERSGYLLDWGVHACLLGSRGSIGGVLGRCGSDISISPAGAAVYHKGILRPFLGERLMSITGQKVLTARDLLHLGASVLRQRGKRSYETTVNQWVREQGASTGLELVLEALCVGLLATDQYDRASIGELFAFMRQSARRLDAVGYPQGGWGPVIRELLRVTKRSSRNQVRFETRLERICAPGNRVEGVVVNGEEVAARAVVCAFPPQRLADQVELEPPLPEHYRLYISSLEESSGICVEMGLGEPVTSDGRILFSVDPPALIWAVSNISPEVAPPGKQLLQFFSPVHQEKRQDEAFVKSRTEEIIDTGSRIFGISLPEEWRRTMATTIGGVVPFADQCWPHRPSIDVPGYSGLYLAGDGVSVKGLGGDLAVRSAFAVRHLINDYISRR